MFELPYAEYKIYLEVRFKNPSSQLIKQLESKSMKHQTSNRKSPSDNLTVSYKSPGLFGNVSADVSDSIILTDSKFSVTGWNPTTEFLFGRNVEEAKGKHLFEIINIRFPGSSLNTMITDLQKTGFWNGEVIYERFDNQLFRLNTSAILVYNDIKIVSGCVIVSKIISDKDFHEKKLLETESKYQTVIDTLFEGVVMINTDGSIGACNHRAAEILGFSQEDLVGKVTASPIWKAINEDGSEFPLDKFPASVTLKTGLSQESITMGIERPDGKLTWLLVNSQAIIEQGKIVAVVASFNDITAIKHANDRIKESEALFRTFMNNSNAYAWICDEDGLLVYTNSLFASVFQMKDGGKGKHIKEIFSAKVAERFLEKNKLFFETGEPKFIIAESERTDGTPGKFALYRFHIPVKAYKGLIGFQAFDVTDHQDTLAELKKTNERFGLISNATSDAIWDQDLETNEIYRSPNFSKLSGYSMNEIQSNLDWWFTKVHPDDKERVRGKVQEYLNGNKQSWEDEYRFLCADGKYKTLYDKGFFIYKDGKPVRIIGAIQDITERKRLEEQLLNEKIKQQKLINKTTIAAQEEERDNISKELHDNVNQLLMSTKLYINMARKQPDVAHELLIKAEEYQLQAVEEIRKLSKKLNSSLVKVLGLKKSIQEVVNTFKQLNDIPVSYEFHDELEDVLMDEQKLMIFRIVQEQSNNIRKYANAERVLISLTRKDDRISLIISDDGVGFKVDEVKSKGVGLTNIASRVNVLNGEYKIESYPGNGCTLSVWFPLYA
jgi:PAS domain S-box-containing protein